MTLVDYKIVKNVQILRNIFAAVTGKGSDLITWEWNPASSLDTLNSSQQKQVQTAIRAAVLRQGLEKRVMRGAGRDMMMSRLCHELYSSSSSTGYTNI